MSACRSPHAAFADLGGDVVVAEASADVQSHGLLETGDIYRRSSVAIVPPRACLNSTEYWSIPGMLWVRQLNGAV